MFMSSHAREVSESAAYAITAQIAACVYWPPFSRTPGTVAADVTGVALGSIEWRRQQSYQSVVAVHEALVDGVHRGARSPGFRRAGKNGPALRDRIDLAFGIGRGSEWRAVVEVGAAIPCAVPAVLLDVLDELGPVLVALLRERGIVAKPRDICEVCEHRAKEERKPDTFPPAVDTHEIHPVVPVAGAHQRQSVRAEAQSVQDRAHAMLVKRRDFRGPRGQVVVRVLAGVQQPTLEEWNELIEDGGVTRNKDVAGRREGQPQVVIRALRAHAASAGRMPPVLDVAFDELATCRQQDLLARQSRIRVQQRKRILQLIAETERAARLVEATASP
jgi:hypothetical protein